MEMTAKFLLMQTHNISKKTGIIIELHTLYHNISLQFCINKGEQRLLVFTHIFSILIYFINACNILLNEKKCHIS